nr:unnamed protein product [Digitaria exilis]
MAGVFPPGFPYPYYDPPPPARSGPSPPPPPPSYWLTPPTPSGGNSSSHGGVIAGVAISVGAFLLVLTFVCSLCQGYRNNRANVVADASAAAAAAALAARPRPPPVLPPSSHYEEQRRLRSARDDIAGGGGCPRRASPTAGLPSFTYNRAVGHNVTGGGEEAATCSVCLGAFQTGETVRLLPVCLHLYHVECIDPWLDAHTTCPICRSGTDPATDGSLLLPPV